MTRWWPRCAMPPPKRGPRARAARSISTRSNGAPSSRRSTSITATSPPPRRPSVSAGQRCTGGCRSTGCNDGAAMKGPRSPAVNLGWRAAVIGALGYLIVKFASETEFYATIVVLAGLVALMVVSMARELARLTRSFERDLEVLAREGADTPRWLDATPELAARRQQTVERLRDARFTAARQVDQARALLDTVPAALIVVRDDGGIE